MKVKITFCQIKRKHSREKEQFKQVMAPFLTMIMKILIEVLYKKSQNCRTHNHQVMSQTGLPRSHPGGVHDLVGVCWIW